MINASIARFFPVHSDVGRLFTRCYADRGIEAVLRPGCQNVREGRFEGTYTNLYGSHVPQTDRLTTGELIQTLKVLCEPVKALKKRKVSILTVIFGDGDEECEALKPFGPVMKLEDVVEACGSG